MRVRSSESMTCVGGLVEFGAYLREQGVDRELTSRFGRLKDGRRGVVYPMGAQLRLMIDVFSCGEPRVFGLEYLAADPLLVHLAGGAVPSIDILYDDLGRFDDKALTDAEAMMARRGLRLVPSKVARLHLDVDTTVECLFGTQEGALPGPNPRYHGRPSYHPLLMRVAEGNGVVGARLRPGDTGFGENDVPAIVAWVRRVREHVGPDVELVVRMDAAGDCTALLRALEAERAVRYIIKARMTPDLVGACALHKQWTTGERDAFDKPTCQTATVLFRRGPWTDAKLAVRTVVIRRNDRDTGKQVPLWDDDFNAHVYLTNDWKTPEFELACEYDDRAGIEPLIADLKGAWGLGKIPSSSFDANHAMLLIKLLAYNLFRDYVAARHAPLARWRTPWCRRALLLRAGRIVRSGRRHALLAQPVAMLPLRC
jgi:hypothetical protein